MPGIFCTVVQSLPDSVAAGPSRARLQSDSAAAQTPRDLLPSTPPPRRAPHAATDRAPARRPQPVAFKVIPSQDELQRLQRQFQFHPCTNAHPRHLTEDQITAFNRDGYIKGIRIFDAAESAGIAATSTLCWPRACRRRRQLLDQHRPPEVRPGVRPAHPPAASCLRHATCSARTWSAGARTSSARCRATARRVAWHQDASYWPLTPVEDRHRLAGDRRRGRGERLHAVHPRLAPPRPPDLPT